MITITIFISRFPEKPNEKGVYEEKNYEKDRIMGIPNSDCDDGKVIQKKYSFGVVFYFKITYFSFVISGKPSCRL